MDQTKIPGVTGNSIRLASGGYFDFANPKISDFCIRDIASGLSNACRFAGQLDSYYSVAEHCLHCLKVAQDMGLSWQLQRSVFMHDAAEAYCGDVPKPLKILLSEYRKIEDRIQRLIDHKFSLVCDPVIKQIDLMVLKAEKSKLSKQDDQHDLSSIKTVEIDFDNYSPHEAWTEFLRAADDLDFDNI